MVVLGEPRQSQYPARHRYHLLGFGRDCPLCHLVATILRRTEAISSGLQKQWGHLGSEGAGKREMGDGPRGRAERGEASRRGTTAQ